MNDQFLAKSSGETIVHHTQQLLRAYAVSYTHLTLPTTERV